MSLKEAPPELAEVRDLLDRFEKAVANAADFFPDPCLTPDPNGPGWGWDSLRGKVRAALESFPTYRDSYLLRYSPDDLAELAEFPDDIREAVQLHEALRVGEKMATAFYSGASTLPGAVKSDDFIAAAYVYAGDLREMRRRMEGEDELT